MATMTVHEFLSRLAASSPARSAFAADPRSELEQAGLGEMGTTDVVQAASSMLDYAPIDAVEEYVRTLQPGLGHLAGANTHAAMTYMTPFLVNGPDTMESDMTSAIFSQLGDVDEMLRGNGASYSEQTTNVENSNNSTDNSQQMVGSGNQTPVGSGNEVGLVGDVTTGDLNVGNIAGNGVTDVVGGVQDTVTGNGVTDVVGGVQDTVGGIEGGDVMGKLSDVTGTGDVTGTVRDIGQSMTDTGEVTNALPVDTGALTGQLGDVMAPVTGAEGPVGTVAGDLTGGDVTGGLGI